MRTVPAGAIWAAGALVLLGCIGAPRAAAQPGNGAPAAQTPQATRAMASPAPATPHQQHLSDAMDRYEAILTTVPGDVEARNGERSAATAWALELARGPHPEQSLEVLGRAATHMPDDPEILRSLGVEATTLQRFPLATQALQAALALRPEDAKNVYAMARLETEEHHLPDAERDLRLYVAMRPDDASGFFGLGHVYAMEERSADARQAFEHSIALQPLQTESYFQLGQLDLEAHQDETARTLFARTLARNPHHAGALTGMGQLALRSKRYGEAERLLAQAEQSDPAFATPHYFRGLALAKLGRKEEAQQELRRGDSRPHVTLPDAAGEIVSPAGGP